MKVPMARLTKCDEVVGSGFPSVPTIDDVVQGEIAVSPAVLTAVAVSL